MRCVKMDIFQQIRQGIEGIYPSFHSLIFEYRYFFAALVVTLIIICIKSNKGGSMFSGDKTLRTNRFLIWFLTLFFGNLAFLLYIEPDTLYLLSYMIGVVVITFALKSWRR